MPKRSTPIVPTDEPPRRKKKVKQKEDKAKAVPSTKLSSSAPAAPPASEGVLHTVVDSNGWDGPSGLQVRHCWPLAASLAS